MKSIIIALLLPSCSVPAFALESSAYLSTGLGYSLTSKKDLANLGLFARVTQSSLTWWQYTAIEPQAGNEWFSHTQAIDFRFDYFTTSMHYKISNDIKFDRSFDKEIGFKLEVVLW